ncbi:MAG TPA: hypothetical protein VG778_03025 [Blastocatellia bacterium]|jgi:hypothetical protein|nr:hypothetical protein [Blastocatellia bacterium]
MKIGVILTVVVVFVVLLAYTVFEWRLNQRPCPECGFRVSVDNPNEQCPECGAAIG